MLRGNSSLSVIFEHFIKYILFRVIDACQAIQFVIEIQYITQLAVLIVPMSHLMHHAANIAVILRLVAIFIMECFGIKLFTINRLNSCGFNRSTNMISISELKSISHGNIFHATRRIILVMSKNSL